MIFSGGEELTAAIPPSALAEKQPCKAALSPSETLESQGLQFRGLKYPSGRQLQPVMVAPKAQWHFSAGAIGLHGPVPLHS